MKRPHWEKWVVLDVPEIGTRPPTRHAHIPCCLPAASNLITSPPPCARCSPGAWMSAAASKDRTAGKIPPACAPSFGLYMQQNERGRTRREKHEGNEETRRCFRG